MDLIKLGQILKNKRNEIGLSLREASQKIGISHNYLSIIEKAKDPRSNAPITPTIDTLKLLSDFYKIDVNHLLKLAGYDDITIHKHKNIDRVDKAIGHDDPELREFWEEMKERESLQLMFKQVKNMDDRDIKQIMRIIKAIEDEEDKEDL